MNPKFLDIEDVFQIHESQLATFGGSAGVRDLGALHSALAMPGAGFGEDYFHKNIFEMAAAYLFHLAQNHALVDGNKRVALTSAIYFLHKNGQEITATDEELIGLTLDTASGKADKARIATFFKKHAKMVGRTRDGRKS